jgi:branched-chain amino acid transport system ATP-binding protein
MLEVQGLVAGYAQATVLRGIDLSVADGAAVALLGRNGMGKTTLLRAVCGLRPPTWSAGSIRFAGRELSGLKPDQVAVQGIGLVPQGRRVFPSLSVRENLHIGARPSDGGWDLDKLLELFPRLGERSRQMAGTLSGGEQQMLAIGRALMMNPRLLVMDEPSEGLAPAVLEQMLERLLRIRHSGQALLIAEQNVDLALDMADTVSILGDAGTIAWSGTSETLRAQPRILEELVGLAIRPGGSWR